MKWSFKIGQLAGTSVYVHVTFFGLLAWIGVAWGLEKGSVSAALGAVGFTTTLFACVLLHEFGHAFMARHFGIQTRDIILLPFGGVGRLERIPDIPSQEFFIALAGPAVSVGIAAVLFAALGLQGPAPRLEDLVAGEAPFLQRLMLINLVLAVFNLLPAFPMDGGRVLRALLAMRFDYLYATDVAARMGQTLAVVFAIIGVLGNPLLVIIALFVWMGATGEAGLAHVKAALHGATVDAAMRSEFGVLAPDDTLDRAAELTTRYAQAELPVLARGQIVGLLSRSDLAQRLREYGSGRRVGDVMRGTFQIVDATEPLDAAFERLVQAPRQSLLVTDGGRLVGLVGLDEITSLLRIRQAAVPRALAH